MSTTNRQSRLDTLKIREAEGTLTKKERTEPCSYTFSLFFCISLSNIFPQMYQSPIHRA